MKKKEIMADIVEEGDEEGDEERSEETNVSVDHSQQRYSVVSTTSIGKKGGSPGGCNLDYYE
jgi:hypothetical protein